MSKTNHYNHNKEYLSQSPIVESMQRLGFTDSCPKNTSAVPPDLRYIPKAFLSQQNWDI